MSLAVLFALLVTPGPDQVCNPGPRSSPFVPAGPFNITWTAKHALPKALAGSACAVINDTIYVIGGRDSAGNRYNSCYMYIPTQDTWILRASMPTARAHVVCGIVRGKIYVIGGWVGSAASAACEEYDPVANTWTIKTAMPTPRYTSGSATHNNLIYVIGGMNMSGQVFGSNEVYNPDSNTWATKSAMPTARIGGATFLVGNSIYVAGGSNLSNALTVHEAYDIGADQWQVKTSLQSRRYCIGACSYQAKGYAIGGYDYLNYVTTVEVYDPALNSWSFETPMQNGRQSTAVGLVQNRIYVIGGWNNGALPYNEEGAVGGVEVVDGATPDRRTMGLSVHPNPARRSFTLNTSDVLRAGGFRGAIHDATGRLVQDLSGSFQGSSALTLSLPAGVYFVLVESGSTRRQTKVVVVD